MSSSADSPGARITLADGKAIPILGLGVWQIPKGRACVDAVLWALELGYRHVDTAQVYGNEESVGEALRRGGVPRDQVFITTKFDPTRQDPAAEAERSLDRLGVEYVDLYLIHWPARGATWAWPGMESTHERGYARSIGVSNFGAAELEQVVARAAVRPVVNQIELNPFAYRRALVEEGRRRRVVSEAYSPLGTGRHLRSSVVKRIASRVDRTPAQVLLRWCVQRDLVVIPKSTHRDRIAENARIFDFALTTDDVAELDGLDRTGGSGEALEQKWW
jgi:diketogulonate reductase-like aldo/keto reductase